MIYVLMDMMMLGNMFFFCSSQEEPKKGYVWSTKMQYSISTGILENLAKQSYSTGSFLFS